MNYAVLKNLIEIEDNLIFYNGNIFIFVQSETEPNALSILLSYRASLFLIVLMIFETIYLIRFFFLVKFGAHTH